MGAGLRKFGEGNTYTHQKVHESLLRGELQPAFITGSVMAQILIDTMRGDEHLVFDGFPRTTVQLSDFNSAIEFYQREAPTILNVVVPEGESIKRLLARGRNDDTEAVIRNRLAWSKAQVEPTIGWFRTHEPYRVVDIDGVGSIDEIQSRILRALRLA